MKKILMISIVLLLSAALFADSTANGKVSELSGGGASATLNYSLNLLTADTYNIGFSDTAIGKLSDVPEPSSDITLNPENGVFTVSNSSVYVYWQILSSSNCTIKLEATSLVLTPDNEEIVDSADKAISLTISTEAAGGEGASNGNPVPRGVKTIGTDATTFTEIKDGENSIFEFVPTATNHQAAGSQKLTVTTDDFTSKVAGNYTAQLKLTIASN